LNVPRTGEWTAPDCSKGKREFELEKDGTNGWL
jgi:hypothetical protein